MEGERCPECDRPFAVVWRVTIGESKGGYRSAVPPGTRDLARCETCGADFERGTDDGRADIGSPERTVWTIRRVVRFSETVG